MTRSTRYLLDSKKASKKNFNQKTLRLLKMSILTLFISDPLGIFEFEKQLNLQSYLPNRALMLNHLYRILSFIAFWISNPILWNFIKLAVIWSKDNVLRQNKLKDYRTKLKGIRDGYPTYSLEYIENIATYTFLIFGCT